MCDCDGVHSYFVVFSISYTLECPELHLWLSDSSLFQSACALAVAGEKKNHCILFKLNNWDWKKKERKSKRHLFQF